jgi:tetratricopeptide (TPR) repeat protein
MIRIGSFSPILILGAAVLAGPAFAQSEAGIARPGDRAIVIGQSFAEVCYERARAGDASRDGLDQCDYALQGDLLPEDRAATYVNRGIIREARGDPDAALADYADALALSPSLAEAHVNVGRIHSQRRNWSAAAAALDQAIPLIQDPLQLRTLYFDRAVAHEEMGDIAQAYADYQAASAADPTWDAPKQELERFEVNAAAGGGA